MCNDIGPNGGELIAMSLQVIQFIVQKNFFLNLKYLNKNITYKKNIKLVYLNLNGNKIGNKGGMCMAQMLQVNFTLEHLDLGDTDQVIYFKKNFIVSPSRYFIINNIHFLNLN